MNGLTQRLRIQKSRIGVLIGSEGKTRSRIEEFTKCILDIDSEEGWVNLQTTRDLEDPSMILVAKDIVLAIGNGFSPKKAFYLLDEDTYIEVIKLDGSQNFIKRIKSRIIGEKGKTRFLIEKATNSYISIFGNKISIIGELEEIRSAKDALEMLIKGTSHSSVYKFLERLQMEDKSDPLKIWKDNRLDD